MEAIIGISISFAMLGWAMLEISGRVLELRDEWVSICMLAAKVEEEWRIKHSYGNWLSIAEKEWESECPCL